MIQNIDIEFTLSTFNTLKEFVKSFKHDDTHKYCVLLSDEHTCLIKVIGPDILYCGEWRKISSPIVTLTLIRLCPFSNLSEIFSYTTMYSNFMFVDPLFL